MQRSAVSTFELLVKPIIPRFADQLGAGRTVIQGYFLTITHLDSTNEPQSLLEPLSFNLKFTATSPNFTVANMAAFWDTTGTDTPVEGTAPIVIGTSELNFSLTLNRGDTGLFILQPNITNPDLVTAANLELRGYAEISLGANAVSADLILTPEHRGTFLPVGFTVPRPGARPPARSDFDHLVNTLPLVGGNSLFQLRRGRRASVSEEALTLETAQV
jgi:hypothetical protein